MPPRIAIFVRGGVVQEGASETAGVLIRLLDMDSIEEGDHQMNGGRRMS
jgi:hypothetical protein